MLLRINQNHPPHQNKKPVTSSTETMKVIIVVAVAIPLYPFDFNPWLYIRIHNIYLYSLAITQFEFGFAGLPPQGIVNYFIWIVRWLPIVYD